MTEYHDHRDDCPFKFAPLDVCDCVEKNMLDRIEALIKERDTAREYAGEVRIREKVAEDARIEAEAKLSICEKYRDAYAEMGRIGTQAVRDLEAKLAKAVEGLHAVVQHEASTFFGSDGEKNKRASWRGVMRKVRATLAEIKGESHD